MKMLKRVASTNAIHLKICVLIDPNALTIITIFHAIVLARITRVNNAIPTVSRRSVFGIGVIKISYIINSFIHNNHIKWSISSERFGGYCGCLAWQY